MKKTLVLFALVFAVLFAGAVPNTSAQERGRRGRTVWQHDGDYNRRHHDRRRNDRRRSSYYGYRNYGQYRRTQVGNRRYRSERRYYWTNGRRQSRMMRVYY